VKKRGDRSHTSGVRGGSPECAGEFPKSSSPWCSSSPGIGAYAPPFPWGFILSPSATLRVAGLALWVKVEHTTV